MACWFGDRQRSHALSPAAIVGSNSALSASVPAYRIAVAERTVEEKYGAQSRARPISSTTIANSPAVKPWPP